MRVLVIEDEPLVQGALVRMLTKKGAQVSAVGLGRDAIALIHSEAFDRIVCDLMLQDITGFEVIEEAKKKMTLKNIQKKFIIISAYCSPEVLQKAEAIGCKVFSKPFASFFDFIDHVLTCEKDEDEDKN